MLCSIVRIRRMASKAMRIFVALAKCEVYDTKFTFDLSLIPYEASMSRTDNFLIMSFFKIKECYLNIFSKRVALLEDMMRFAPGRNC